MQHYPAELLNTLERFGEPRILVIGDLILDQYVFGDAERLSPEAPVPVLREQSRELRVGGAGNVAVFLAALGAKPELIGLCGKDSAGESLKKLLSESGVDVNGVIVSADRPTSAKTRFVGLAQHRHQQQMLRLDHETTEAISSAVEQKLLEVVEKRIAACSVVCLEDYNKGLLTPGLCAQIIRLAKAAGKAVLVDPAAIKDYSRYTGATAITPNRTEAEHAAGLRMQDATREAPRLAGELLEKLQLEACILTLDRHGMYLLEKNGKGQMHATRARNIYDVTGAGDMVLAMLAMARAGGASWSVAVDLGNVAGGLEVERFGSVPITREEIRVELKRLEGSKIHKISALQDLTAELKKCRQAGQKIVFTNGVFDIIHAGHAQYLQFARGQGDILVVGVNTDESVRRLKGSDRPINPLTDRMAVLAALEAVSYVISFDEPTPLELIRMLEPDILVKGADYKDKEVVGRDVVQARGGKVVLAPFLEGRSTTKIIHTLESL
ncbi:MAG TPA: D-glycero-beta-D-manno-heptose 1-phosphate adenylyltransferase [Phycisphaerae bacterium]|nr:D-glycero-beta-D-manno-heptose 1-phosphate adenylyltransferase [Phycisphaerae bacterium]